MRFLAAFLLIACSVWAHRPQATHPEGWRLVRVSDDIEFWASPEQIVSLAMDEVGFVDVTDTYDLEEFAATYRRHPVQSYPTSVQQQALVRQFIGDVDIQSYFDTLSIFENNPNATSGWNTRNANSEGGVRAANWLAEQAGAITSATGVGSVSVFPNTQFNQNNVIARIPGDGSDNNLVILGAHLDSIAGGVNSIAPGADDDGSGSMLLLEVLRVVTARVQSGDFRPKRPIEFHWYAGEEMGLVGSRNMANDYARRNVPVYSMFQFDMIGYPSTFNVGIGVITDFTSPALTDFLRLLIDEYLTIGYTNGRCNYGCSDHASWTSAGYASVFPFEAPFGQHSPFIHSNRDTIANNVDRGRSEQFHHLAVAYVAEASLF